MHKEEKLGLQYLQVGGAREVRAARIAGELQDTIAELFGSPVLPHAALTDVGLDNLSAAFLANHLQQKYGMRLEPTKLFQKKLSVLQLAHGIASAVVASQPNPQQALKRTIVDSHEIEVKLLTIIEGEVSPQYHLNVFPVR